jgi:hypothetical protein
MKAGTGSPKHFCVSAADPPVVNFIVTRMEI